MKKTALEKRIAEKASKKYYEEVKIFIKFLEENPIAKKLKIQLWEEKALLIFSNYNVENLSAGVIATSCDNKIQEDTTNIKEVKEELLEKYTEEALNEILEQTREKSPHENRVKNLQAAAENFRKELEKEDENGLEIVSMFSDKAEPGEDKTIFSFFKKKPKNG